MVKSFKLCCSLVLCSLVCLLIATKGAAAQQTLGAITGTVADPSGSVVPGAMVTATSEDTKLVRTATSNAEGTYSLVNLPIGKYTITISMKGFSAERIPGIVVQADRTVSLPGKLEVGAASDSVEVDLNPLLNATDTTNGYVLDKAQIESIPLPTGSFTGVAILSPGVNAELSPGTGANEGLGNLPIWANGQRDTSNSFSINGVDASNLFNGKSTSDVGSARVVNSTGVSSSTGAGGVISSTASIYLSIGNAIPTPAPETLQEVRVNASMYDASQGSTSGAHIDISTASGTNDFHGTAYLHHGTNWINAAPFFFKQDQNIPENLKNPQLHRYLAGGTIGGPIIKNKLFAYLAYQHLQVSDQEIGDSFLDVPVGLSDSNRNAAGLAGLANQSFCTPNDVINYHCTPLTAANIDVNAVPALFNAPSLPGEPGKWLIPNATSTPSVQHIDDAFIPGTGRFKADMVVADLDYNATSKDTVSLKYFYQHDPTLAPYAYSSVPGFTEQLDSGAQVFSVINTFLVKPNLSTTQTVGYVHEKIYGNNKQPFGPSSIPTAAGSGVAPGSINEFGSTYFPGVSIYNVLGDHQPSGESQAVLNIGPNAEGQSSNTGVFQNRFAPSGNAIWTLGKHTLSFGVNYSYTNLDTIDNRTGIGTIATDDFSQFVQGYVTPGSSSTGFYVSSFLQGDANRFYRANQLGSYVQDKFQVTPNLSLTAGLRYDWDGGLTEKYGRIFNFDSSNNPNDVDAYSYNVATDTIVSPGLVIAGNNNQGSEGVSDTTLTGRQWGIGPRLGAAWQPDMFHNKVVVRAGTGIYYDRGELFSYFSPGYAIGTVTGGPFGVNQQLPFVNASSCPTSTLSFYQGYIPTCGGAGDGTAASAMMGNLENPYGTSLLPPPNNPKATDLFNYLPNANAIANEGGQPISLGVYDRANKLPYTINYTMGVQWQPRNDVAIELDYVGNVGRHQVIPVPFNQPNIASPSNPLLKGGPFQQKYTYGYDVLGATLPDGTGYQANYEGGNVDLRVPYIGYAAESIDYKAAGVDAYNALQVHVDKRMSRGIQVSASYTYSHALDEQSGLGLFYNGNNALNLRSGYGSADFDRTHVVNFNYVFRAPDIAPKHSIAGYGLDGWSLVGLTVLQSGQPYSVIDYSGAVGSIYYSTSDGITNPIVPLAPGYTAKSAKTGKSGAFGDYALNQAAFTLPLLPAGGLGGAIPTSDPYETTFTTGQRNIFRQSFQKRADASLVKMTELTSRYTLKYTFDVYNLTNTTSFDVPGNEVAQNSEYNAFPSAGEPISDLYSNPSGLGVVTHTIGSPRQIQMSLQLMF